MFHYPIKEEIETMTEEQLRKQLNLIKKAFEEK